MFRKRMLLILTLAAFGSLATAQDWAPPPGEHPRLVFRQTDLPALRKRLETPRGRFLFNLVRGDAAHQVLRAGGPVNVIRRELAAAKAAAEAEGREVSRRQHGQCDRALGLLENAALVYVISGDEEYGRAAADALVELVEFAGGTAMRSTALIYDWVYDLLDEEQRTVVRAALARAAREVRESMDREPFAFGPAPVNQAIYWGLLQSSYVGIAQLAMEGEPGADPGLLADAERGALEALNRFLDEAGYHENGPAYVGYGFSHFNFYLEALRLRGHDWSRHPRLRRMLEWYCYLIRPGSLGANPMTIPAGNSNFGLTTGQDAFIWLYHAMPENPYAGIACRHVMAPGYANGYFRTLGAQFLWDRPYLDGEAEALAGLPRSKWFPDGGLYVRSGWEQNDLVFWLKTQQYRCNTGKHEDYGSFLLEAWGEVFATEAGAKVVESAAHNLVFINGRAMDRASYLMPSQPLIELLDSPVATIAVTDLTEAYSVDSHYTEDRRGIEPRPLNPVEHYRRLGGVVWGSHGAADYAIISDDLRKDDNEHDYLWQMLVPDYFASADTALPGGLTLVRDRQPTERMNPPVLDCLSIGPEAPLTLEPGNGGVADFQRLLAGRRAENPRFTVLLSPRVPDGPAFFAMRPPAYRALNVSGGHGAILDWRSQCRDRILLSHGGAVETAGIATDARLAIVRDDGRGKLLAIIVIEASRLQVDGTVLLLSNNPVSVGIDVTTGEVGVGVAAVETLTVSGLTLNRASRYSGVRGGLELMLSRAGAGLDIHIPAPFFDADSPAIEGGPRPRILEAP